MLEELAAAELPAMREIHSRLAKLYPEYRIAHMPSEAIQGSPAVQWSPSTGADSSANAPNEDAQTIPSETAKEEHKGEGEPESAECNQFVGNAAVYGDCFQWHIDADPTGFPLSPWVSGATSTEHCNANNLIVVLSTCPARGACEHRK